MSPKGQRFSIGFGPLTRAETNVMETMVKLYETETDERITNETIANALGVTVDTIKTHLRVINRKIGTRSKAQAMIWYINNVKSNV